MPVPLRASNHRAEAKYNVTTEFPSLGLHSAAANGNVGLVEYALAHGQPINSVLDGVLPLHAACAGGNVQVVKLLIDHGADVNAPRLPRRYSNDKNRDASAPIVGTSGSTPLHFAAANGNTHVVTTLLLHGAHANRPDKHGVTPQMLALQNGWIECADALKAWVDNKDRDLREREERRAAGDDQVAGTIPMHRHPSNERIGSLVAEGETSSSTRKRIHMKRSIDTALNILKVSSAVPSDAYLKPVSSPPNNMSSSTPPASPTKPLGEYSFYAISPSDEGPNSTESPRRGPTDLGARRPSLPHIMTPPPGTLSGSTPTRNGKAPITLNPSVPSPPRPRSAGTGADREQMIPTFGRGGAGRKLGNKYSLLGLFKKGQTGEVGANAGAHGLSSKQTTLMIHQISAGVSLTGATPASASTSNLPLSGSPQQITVVSPGPSSSSPNVNETNVSATSGSSFSLSGLRFRMGGDANARSRTPSQSQHHLPLPTSSPPPDVQSPHHPQPLQASTPPSTFQPPQHSPPHPHIPLAVELHNVLAQHQFHQTRDRSASAGSGTRFELPVGLGFDEMSSSPPARLGVLREQRHPRDRSQSRGSAGSGRENRNGAVFDDDLAVPGVSSSPGGGEVSKTRPGILRGHNRSTSSGLAAAAAGSASGSGFRALRFDSASSGSAGAGGKRLQEGDQRRESPGHGKGVSRLGVGLRASNSAGSLAKFKNQDTAIPGSDSRTEANLVPDSAPAAIGDFDHPPVHDDVGGDKEECEEEEYIYGRPISRDDHAVVDPAIADSKSHLTPSQMRMRGLSFASSSDSSLSPVLSNGDEAAANGEFPFSINEPPPLPMEESDRLSPGSRQHLRVPSPGDKRSRGDSMSSTSTTDSRSDPQPSNETSSGSTTITTPLLSPGKDRYLESSMEISSIKKDEELDSQPTVSVDVPESTGSSANVVTNGTVLGGLNKRRTHTPLDINISSISSHAQAEALVQRAQQDIFELANTDVLGVSSPTGSAGWTPLSARLAAYGESLALERKLREQKVADGTTGIGDQDSTGIKGDEGAELDSEKRGQTQPQSSWKTVASAQDGFSPSLRTVITSGNDPWTAPDQASGLQNKSRVSQPRTRPSVGDTKRPHTSTGTSEAASSRAYRPFGSDRSSRSHHTSRSASAADSSQPSAISTDPDPDSPITPHSSQAHFQSTTNRTPLYGGESSAEYDQTFVRSHTPVADSGNVYLSRISSLDGTDETGSELCRVSTAPNSSPSPGRGKRDQARHIASATKLTRMGFAAPDLAGRSPPANKRFGGFKSLMQSLKGKS